MADIIRWAKDRKKEVERGVSAVVAQVNPLDNGRTYRTVMDKGRNYAPQAPQSVVQQVKTAAPRVGTGLGLGAVRSVTGLAQGFSGLYDLKTPGTGTNRVSDTLDRFAKFTDQTAKNEGVGSVSYKGGQLATDLLAFRGAGFGVKAASKAPMVAKVAKPLARVSRPVTSLANKATANLAKRGAGGRIAAVGVRNATNPVNVANMALNTGIDLGAESGKGRDISKQDVLIAGSANLGFGVGVPMAGQTAKEALRVSAPVVKQGAQRTAKVAKQAGLEPTVERRLQAESAEYQAVQESARNKAAQINGYVQAGKRPPAHLERGYQHDLDTMAAMRRSGKSKGSLNPDYSDVGVPAPKSSSTRTASNTGQAGSTSTANIVPSSGRVSLPPTVAPKTVAAQSAPPMKPPTKTLTAPAGDMQQPPNGQITVAPMQGKQKTTRYAAKTVPESEYVSEPVGKNVKANAPLYDPQTEKARYTDSLSRVKQEGEEAFATNTVERLNTAKPGQVSSQDVADGQTIAAMLDAKGDTASLQRASEIYEKLSEHLTAAGQTVQAAAILSRRTPQGMYYQARRTITQSGGSFTPQLQREVRELIGEVSKTKPGTRERAVAVGKLSQKVAENVPQGTVNNLIGVWKAGLLSGTRTFTGGVLSNVTFGALKKLSDAPTAAVDKLISLKTGQRTVTNTTRGIAQGTKEGARNGLHTLKTGVDLRNAGDKYEQHAGINFKNKVVQKIVGNPANKVFHALSALDQPVYYAALKNSLYDMAKADGINRGLKGQGLKQHMDNVVANPTEQLMEIAVRDAEKAVLGYDTFMSKAITMAKTGIDNLPGASEAGKQTAKAVIDILAPFVKVPSAFISRTFDFTPLGIGKEVFRQIAKKQFDQRALSKAIGEGITGTGVVALGISLTQNDLLSGDYPKDDPKEAQRWKAEGIQPNSVKLGNTWVSLNYLGPIGLLFNAGRNFEKAETENVLAQSMAAVGGLGQGLLGQSFLQGFSGFSDAIQDPERSLDSFINSQASSVIPSWANDIGTMTDEWQRQADTMGQSIKNRVPFLRETNPVKQDVYGNPLSTASEGLNKISPFKPSDNRSNPVIEEVNRLHSGDPEDKDLQVTPTEVNKYIKVGDQKFDLTNEQVYELQKRVGQATQDAWGQLIKTPEYQALSDREKAAALTDLRGNVAEAASRDFQAEKQVGTYDPESKGQISKPSKAVQAIQNGNLDVTTYAKGGDTKNNVTLKGDTRGTSLLDKVGTMTKDQQKKWEASDSLDEKYKDVYDRANTELKPKDWPDLPPSNKVLTAYADYLKAKEKNPSKLKLENLKKDFIKNSYKAGIAKESQEILSASANDILDGLDRGLLSKEQLDEAIEFDNLMVQLGLSSSVEIPKAVRKDLGYGTPEGSGSGRGGSKRNKVPTDLLGVAIKTPNIGRARQASFNIAAPKAPRFSVPKVRRPQIKTDNLNRLLGATKVA